MPAYLWKVSYNGGALEDFGIAISQGTFFFDAIALTTYGFIYGTGSVWPSAEDCVDVVWADAEACVSTTWSPA